MIGPVLGGFFVLSATGEPITTNTDLYKPYLIVAVVVAIIAFIFVISKVLTCTRWTKPRLLPQWQRQNR